MEMSEKDQISEMFAAVNTLIGNEIQHLQVYHRDGDTQKFDMCMYKMNVLIDAKTAMRLALDGAFKGYV